MDPANLAILLTAINKFVLGDNLSNISEKTMKIGDASTIKPDERADLFLDFCEVLKESVNRGVSPERFGDALALATVLLHPFKDGNGRTARVIGMIFRDDFDKSLEDSFNTLAESRDVKRNEGGFVVNGYIPRIEPYGDRSSPEVVLNFLKDVLNNESNDNMYTGPYGQAELKPQC
jgi:hypothetical protein